MLINLKVDGRLEFGFKGIGFIMIWLDFYLWNKDVIFF